MQIVIEGFFTKGHYNEMEAGYPVFINGDSLSDAVKKKLAEAGLSANFCDNHDCWPGGVLSENKLIGKKVTITLDIED